ncbi:MAG: hypothetical protein COU63_03025 [Candidatus Pacebacteria bacterium CG10_big_fil_rev_8_21_14_0_10_36_11]|jgi:hypothetical protein|nr:MAG: hypothetical protein AUK08_01280 [Candidatus Pacebacteria bacterium CG2_30_36_39]PIR64964.1 MAG: hypothetical protein COU63_03025 [Candidatus Pacebacteria bacterium CG10_big_fil_rev_8_21_14_0_10_36_11]PJC42499.1 MAG: hypothetical protein CO040_04060 [Candidatus Pacebacteria bacterium CG_4_9_14_0_2_um_filter_36_8]
MTLVFLKPNWLTIVLFSILLMLPVIDGYPALVLIFSYLWLGELYGLLLILGFTILAYIVASGISRLTIFITNKLLNK